MPPALLVLLLSAALLAAPAHAESIGGNPGPAHNYVCPHADGKPALDCYLDAVQHKGEVQLNLTDMYTLVFQHCSCTAAFWGKDIERNAGD